MGEHYEYGKVFFNGEVWEIHREGKGKLSFAGKWDNDIQALNALAAQEWELVTSFYEPPDPADEEATFGTPCHMVRCRAME